MRNIAAIAKRELRAYFATPIAYVFLVMFVALTGVFTFEVGGFFERGQADLKAFFDFHPWLYLVLVPAISMRLWAEERKTGTVELLMTMPVSAAEAVIGKFIAGWLFLILALVLTFPLWITVNVLGDPDNGVIVASYAGSVLMAGAYLAVGACFSALTRNQVIAFILAAVACFVLVMSGSPMVLGLFQGWLPEFLLRAIGSMSFLTHFQSITRGILDAADRVFYLSLIVFFLFANTIAVELRKAE